MFSTEASVYERVLGDDFALLAPALQRYFGRIPADAAGVGIGRYEVAGSSRRALRPVWALLARRHVLFPERGYDVPFGIENRRDGDALIAVRRFDLEAVTRWMRDRMVARDGVLVDRIGTHGGLEVSLTATVVNGGMRLNSTSLAWRRGRLRIPLPHVVRMSVSEDADGDRQRVDVRLRARVVGEVFRYTGTFTYRIVESPGPVRPPL